MDKREDKSVSGVFVQRSVRAEKGREKDRMSAEEMRAIGERRDIPQGEKTDKAIGWGGVALTGHRRIERRVDDTCNTHTHTHLSS